jgi:hypothetical protein
MEPPASPDTLLRTPSPVFSWVTSPAFGHFAGRLTGFRDLFPALTQVKIGRGLPATLYLLPERSAGVKS